MGHCREGVEPGGSLVKIPPRQNVHFHDGAVLSHDLSFHAAMTELRRLGGPNYELVISHRKAKVYAKDGRLIAYATPVSDGLTESTDAILRANGGDRPLIPSEDA